MPPDVVAEFDALSRCSRARGQNDADPARPRARSQRLPEGILDDLAQSSPGSSSNHLRLGDQDIIKLASIASDNLSDVSEPTAGLNNDVLGRVLEAAARLQRLVPDAVLVGGSAAALHAGHRDSYDHDHVVADLAERFDAVLEAVESQDGWVTNRVTPGKIILGELGGIETGIRQLIRRTPLEVAHVRLPSGQLLTAPTPEETLRVKAFLIVRRNQTRDYLDVAALAARFGTARSAAALSDIDRFYADQHRGGDGVASQLARQLADPRPKDVSTTRNLGQYKNLALRWQNWAAVVLACRELAGAMLSAEDAP